MGRSARKEISYIRIIENFLSLKNANYVKRNKVLKTFTDVIEKA